MMEQKTEAGRGEPVVFVVSDAIGETAEAVARAALSQFNSAKVVFRRISHVHGVETVLSVVEEASRHRSAIIYTIIVPEVRAALKHHASRVGIPAVDVMGPVMDALSAIIEEKPKLQPGLVHRLDAEYFRRIEAIEFAVKSDDGKDPKSLHKADVILLGVSRTSKTPVSLYLAQRCYMVANVPLIPEVEPPKEIRQVAAGKAVGLTIDPQHLVGIRRERLKAIGLSPDSSYASPERIQREIEYAHGIFRELGCPVVDVTNRAVEETAAKVLQMLKQGT